MIVYFGTNGQLLETIDTYTLEDSNGDVIDKSFITASGNISSNKIFAFIEGETPTALQCSITYKMPNGSIFENSSIPCDAVLEASIAYDHDRDIYHFKYGKVYRFLEFDLPSALLTTGGEGAYWTNITLYPSTQQARAYSQFSFKAGGSPSQLVENEITDTQYQLILARFSNCVPYTGAGANVNLGNYSLTANSVNLLSGVYTCSLDVSDSGEPFVGTYANGNNIVWLFSIDETGVKTIATREWVDSKLYNSYVPYSGARLNVDIGTHTFRCGNLQVRGGVYSCSLKVDSSTKQPFLSAQQTTWNFSLDETGDTIVATREWATSQFITETSADAKYLPLTGGTISGTVTILDTSGTGTDAFTIQGSTGFASLRDFNIDLNNPSPMLWLADTTSRDKGLILDNYGFKVAGGTSVLSKQYRLLLPRDETDSANKTLATREWVQGLLTPNAVGSATTSANINGYNGAQFSIGDNNGLYFFTYGNCSVMIPVYGLVAGTEYKIASALNGGGQAGYQVKVLTYRLTGDGDLQIYQKENFIPTGYTAYLMRIKLY